MIEIIKEGHSHKEGECKLCGCIFKYEDEDIISKAPIYDDYGISWGDDIKITCPTCHKIICIRDSKIA